MASATPVVTSDAASLVEIGGPQTLRFHPDDYQGLATLLVDLLQDREKKQESLVKANLTWAASFSWERTTELTLQSFQTTYSTHKRRH